MLPCARACGSRSGPVLRAACVTLVAVWIAWMPAAHASPQRLEGWLAQVYASPEPVWFTPAGPRPSVMAALALLRNAGAQGLVPDDDALASVEEAVRRATLLAEPRAVAAADAALTTAVLKLLADLRFGQVAPQAVEPHYRVPPKEATFVTKLRAAAAGDALAALVADTQPRYAAYGRLVAALAQYRRLADATPAWPLLDVPAGKVGVGDAFANAALLRERLVVLGDLDAGASGEEGRYTRTLADAVTRFQARHGLASDGVPGRDTIAALNVPPAARVAQIVLSLERMRWLPDPTPGPLIAINIPAFQLWAIRDATATAPAALSMPVIVGRAMRHETPVFLGEMRRVEFNPHWNVPSTILRAEYLARLARDPALLAREEMELVPARGGGEPLTAVDEATLKGLRDGSLRLRQRPGPKNALGGVKFVLPNTMDIYLHGTPARTLFERTRRDFSHGCIRVRDPAELAHFVLGDRPAWTRDAIDAAMAPGAPRAVALAAPIPVLVFYTTATVDRTGRVHFLADVYGHDAKLADALARWRAIRPRASGSPAPHAAGIEVHEPRLRVEAHAAGA
jgi:murein L,D-transpeptidase YcbB/YkuD